MTEGQTQSGPVGSVAEAEGNSKRSIQMNFFAKKKDHSYLGMLYATLTDPDGGGANNDLFKGPKGPELLAMARNGKALGQILGVVFDVKEKEGTLPDGTKKMSLLSIGDFEAVNYDSGEVVNSGAAYLPGYFAETMQSYLKASNGQPAEIALEIVLVPTGKGIPTAYEVRPLIQRPASSPINAMKARLAQAGRLRLPPPPKADQLALPTGSVDVTDPDLAASGGEPEFEEEGQGQEQAPAAAKGKGKVQEPAE